MEFLGRHNVDVVVVLRHLTHGDMRRNGSNVRFLPFDENSLIEVDKLVDDCKSGHHVHLAARSQLFHGCNELAEHYRL